MKCLGIPLPISAIFVKGNNFCDCLFAILQSPFKLGLLIMERI